MSTTKQPMGKIKQLAIAIPAGLVILLVVVLLARWLRGMDAIEGFIQAYPGASPQPEATPEGIPGWVGWQHFLNMFLMVLIIRTGWLIRTTSHPKAQWTAKKPSRFWGKRPQRISLDTWLHLSLGMFWLANGVVFAVLIFTTGHWMRIVPTSWEIFPNALSVGLQYLSLEIPSHSGWASYNSLQVLAYFTTVFLAAPLAILTGARISPAWKSEWRLSKVFSNEIVRKIHFGVMLYFVAFIIIHVTLVLSTGALRNLNVMYAARDEASWVGFWYFAASLVVTIIGWVLARPMFVTPIASFGGKVTR